MDKARKAQDLVERVNVMRGFFTNTNCETCGCLLYNIFWRERGKKIKMSFSKVPIKNPGRYFEKFVKIVEPLGAREGQNTPFCSQRSAESLLTFCNLSSFLVPSLQPGHGPPTTPSRKRVCSRQRRASGKWESRTSSWCDETRSSRIKYLHLPILATCTETGYGGPRWRKNVMTNGTSQQPVQSALKGQTDFTNSQINMKEDKLTTGIHVDPKWKNWELKFSSCHEDTGQFRGSCSCPVRSEETWRPWWTWWTSCLSRTYRAGCKLYKTQYSYNFPWYWGSLHGPLGNIPVDICPLPPTTYLLLAFIDLFLNWLKLVVTVSIRGQWGSAMENYFGKDRNIECKVR